MALPQGEPLNLRDWLGILLGFLGMVTLLGPALHEVFTVGLFTNMTRLIAILVCLGGALSWAVGSLCSRHQRLNVHFVSSAWQMILAGLLNLLLATMFRQWPQAYWNVSTFGSHEHMEAAEFVGMALIVIAVVILSSATIKRKSGSVKAQQEPMSNEQLQAD